ncbi:hypothetical protein EV363DRAFT_1339448, partial [Boletus edulis]
MNWRSILPHRAQPTWTGMFLALVTHTFMCRCREVFRDDPRLGRVSPRSLASAAVLMFGQSLRSHSGKPPSCQSVV